LRIASTNRINLVRTIHREQILSLAQAVSHLNHLWHQQNVQDVENIIIENKGRGVTRLKTLEALHVFNFLDSLSDKDKKSMLHDLSRNNEEAHKK